MESSSMNIEDHENESTPKEKIDPVSSLKNMLLLWGSFREGGAINMGL